MFDSLFCPSELLSCFPGDWRCALRAQRMRLRACATQIAESSSKASANAKATPEPAGLPRLGHASGHIAAATAYTAADHGLWCSSRHVLFTIRFERLDRLGKVVCEAVNDPVAAQEAKGVAGTAAHLHLHPQLF